MPSTDVQPRIPSHASWREVGRSHGVCGDAEEVYGLHPHPCVAGAHVVAEPSLDLIGVALDEIAPIASGA
ncbi:hypothetical protein [Actinacidiphila soli]|uniref:hypothetical protein n=1 Tax=Actinacidiphila soli TaxID=2487275 RepID=UPI000FCC9D1F|nr:hypothetical protein [Actinacidiphila soli]